MVVSTLCIIYALAAYRPTSYTTVSFRSEFPDLRLSTRVGQAYLLPQLAKAADEFGPQARMLTTAEIAAFDAACSKAEIGDLTAYMQANSKSAAPFQAYINPTEKEGKIYAFFRGLGGSKFMEGTSVRAVVDFETRKATFFLFLKPTRVKSDALYFTLKSSNPYSVKAMDCTLIGPDGKAYCITVKPYGVEALLKRRKYSTDSISKLTPPVTTSPQNNDETINLASTRFVSSNFAAATSNSSSNAKAACQDAAFGSEGFGPQARRMTSAEIALFHEKVARGTVEEIETYIEPYVKKLREKYPRDGYYPTIARSKREEKATFLLAGLSGSPLITGSSVKAVVEFEDRPKETYYLYLKPTKVSATALYFFLSLPEPDAVKSADLILIGGDDKVVHAALKP